MKFTKMQGAGNDYIYVNGFEEKITEDEKKELAVRLSDRHFGIGSDGLIFVNPSKTADFEMEMYNGDGSRAEMCGNGIRCVGKYVYDHGLTDKVNITVESCGVTRYLELETENQQVTRVKVNMGSPELRASKIPVIAEGEQVINEGITVGGKEYKMTCVSMGNPHAVIQSEDVDGLDLEEMGPLFETHERFPNRVNTEFIRVLDKQTIRMRVWERGSGETLACGTGCCAAAVACIINGLTEEQVTVQVLGGEIFIQWDRTNNLIYMTGPAVTVFCGEV